LRRLLLFLFSHRTLALLRWDLHFSAVRFGNVVFRKKPALLKRVAGAPRPLYLNLGSGPRGLADDHWINVDGYLDNNVHYLMDFSRRWPFPDNSLDGIFCEHVFEHFDFEGGQTLLREAFRALRPGQSIRIVVPDGNKILRTYYENPAELQHHRETGTGQAMDSVNSYFRQRYDHQFIYDWALLQQQLSDAGFSQIAQVSFQQADNSKPLLLDDPKYEWESLYAEASKPVRPPESAATTIR
jgi:predicted SAM-dependent methyltransferase